MHLGRPAECGITKITYASDFLSHKPVNLQVTLKAVIKSTIVFLVSF